MTYTGRDERTNAVRPPAVPLGELLDVVDRTVRTNGFASIGQGKAGDPLPARHQVVTHHPLHPYDPRNFTSGALVPDHPWGFDPVFLAGAQASTTPRSPAPAFLDQPLPSPPGERVEIDDLVRFVQHPTKAFLRQRLGVVLRDGDDQPDDALPIDPDGLGRWALGTRLLEGRLNGLDEATCAAAAVAAGAVPPGALGERVLDSVTPTVERLVAATTARTGGRPPGALDVDVALGDGRCLVGTVGGVTGDIVRAVTYSRLGPKHRVAAWTRVLALTAAYPDRAFRAVTIGRGGGVQTEVRIAQVAEADTGRRRAVALHHLGILVDLYDRGMCEPVPLYCDTSAAYAAKGARAARDTWTSEWGFPREDQDLAHQMIRSGRAPFSTLLDAPPRAGEAGAGWADGEPSRFGRLAHRLWDGLLANERVER